MIGCISKKFPAHPVKIMPTSDGMRESEQNNFSESLLKCLTGKVSLNFCVFTKFSVLLVALMLLRNCGLSKLVACWRDGRLWSSYTSLGGRSLLFDGTLDGHRAGVVAQTNKLPHQEENWSGVGKTHAETWALDSWHFVEEKRSGHWLYRFKGILTFLWRDIKKDFLEVEKTFANTMINQPRTLIEDKK